MFRRFGLHHSGSSLLFKTRKYSTYEACLTRVQTAMKVKRVNEAVAKTAGLLFESEVDAEAKLSLQKFETRLAALNAKFQSNSSFVSKRYTCILIYIYSIFNLIILHIDIFLGPFLRHYFAKLQSWPAIEMEN